MKTVLVVAAHPDDEVLGCGGTIARHASEGDKVYIQFMTDGESARLAATDEMRAHRARSSGKAAAVLGATILTPADLPDNQMDSVPLMSVIRPIEAAIAEVKPSVIYTHHGGDLNLDHRLVHQAVVTACRPQSWCPVKAIYAFEVLSSTEWSPPTAGTPFLPNHFVDITAHLEAKMKAIEAYSSEMREHPHSRSRETVRHLALLRGATHGLVAAEAFVVVREIV